MTGKIAIVGAGICGLGASLALMRKGYQVTLFERDNPPPAGGGDAAFFDWDRKGAGQFRHPHAFLGLMCNLIQDNYPDLLDDFTSAGALRVEFEQMIPPDLRRKYTPEPGDERLWILMCRRATIETVLRRYVERQQNINIISGKAVTGFVVDDQSDDLKVTGLQLGDTTFFADIVIDASGRTTKFPGWFKALGHEIEEEKDDAEIVYFTRHYKLKPGVAEPSADGPERPAGDLGYLKYGLFKCEDGNFSIIICVPAAEIALRKAVNNAEQFDEICLNIPGLQPWVREDVSLATTDSFGFGDIHAVWRHYIQNEKPVALNFFAVGDASVRTNPLYGRGCSIGMQHAHLLADVIASDPSPVQRALTFDARTTEEIRPIFKASLDEDKKAIKQSAAIMAGELVEKSDGFKKWFAVAFGDAMAAAIQNEIHVLRGFLQTFHLLEKPGDFLQDKRIRHTVYRYMLRGRKKNAAARIVNGPNRDEMLTGLENFADVRKTA
ncbi:hypothetical protein GP2143_09380 [marine gamma proteobacterium HTCC2143]|jgi:2-polyprenyl-6-methoxyphenol hydroxylase-like FAD-dependent oxidoreductase|uniref:FAD-dependent oxidoreductase n=1 Tax=marine gamma proteobacterium HTCC2143 TaxID=247633 RepID=A0YFJ2_9GAMM|nr:hypothetical protein GP2143_09380 [marine gamma proteobacterium HTCC2143]